MAKQIKVVDENTVLEVGKFYNIRCGVVINSRTQEVKLYIPVIGEPHKDVQLGVDFKHYHIDGRFIKDVLGSYEVDEFGRTNSIVSTEEIKDKILYSYNIVSSIVIKRRKCQRLTTGINPYPISHTGASKYWKWYYSMIGKRCKGKRCPHLGTLMVEMDGRLVCPLHNLQGCPTKEIIIEAI